MVFYFVERLINYVLLFEVIQHVPAELLALFFKLSVKSQNIGCLITRPHRHTYWEGLRKLLNPLGKLLIDGSLRNFLPHVFEVDFPLVVLKISADFFDPFINLLPVKVNWLSFDLPIKLIVELFFKSIFKHVKQMTYLPLIPDYNFIDFIW